jgi:hypothetical protein
MTTAESYLREINNIDSELKRINIHSKNLREQKKRVSAGLYNYMQNHKLEKISDGKKDITIERFAPKQKKCPSKPKSQKKIDAIELFRDVGIPNPEQFYKDFDNTQKSSINTTDSNNTNQNKGTRTRGKKSEAFDSNLGF